jgi:hypothetical protein
VRIVAEDGGYHSSAYSPGAAVIQQQQQQQQQEQQQQQHQLLQQRRRPARGPRDLRSMDGFVSQVMESARDTVAACNEQEAARNGVDHRESHSSSSSSSGHNDTDAATSTHACLEPSLDRHWPSSPRCECWMHSVLAFLLAVLCT